MFAEVFAGRDFRDVSIAEISAHLHASFKHLADLNPGMMPGLNANVWSDGGCFLPAPEQVSPPSVTVERMDTQIYCASIGEAVDSIKRKIDDKVSPVVSLPCGVGKSTTLMVELAKARIADHVISIQPTPTVAIQLADYQIAKRVNASYGIMKDPLSVSYVAASEFINAVAAGDSFHNSLIVVDEEHLTTPVHTALTTDVLPRVVGKVMKMTASREAELPKRRDVQQREVKSIDLSIIEKMKLPQPLLVVGIDDNAVVHVPGSLITGANIKVATVVDTGRRLDPVVQDNKIVHAERAATKLELTQSQGRINRFDRHKPGAFYYVSRPYVTSPRSYQTSYYAVIYSALQAMFARPDAREVYAPVLNGTVGTFVVPLPSRSVTSGSSGRSTASGDSNRMTIGTRTGSYVTIKPSSSVSGWVSDHRPINSSMFHASASTWWSQKPSALVLASTGSRVITLSAELDNIIVDLNFNDKLAQNSVTPQNMREANDVIAGNRLPLFDDDEIHAVIILARRWIDAAVAPHQSRNLLDNLKNYFLSARNARMRNG